MARREAAVAGQRWDSAKRSRKYRHKADTGHRGREQTGIVLRQHGGYGSRRAKRVDSSWTWQESILPEFSKRRLRHEVGGFWGFSELCAAWRASIFAAASPSFSETSRKNCAVRFSASGATSSFT